MTAVLKLLGSEVTLNTTPTSVSNTAMIRIVEVGGASASLITQKDASNNTLGTITLPKSGEIFIRKSRTDTLQCNSSGTVLATPVVGQLG